MLEFHVGGWRARRVCLVLADSVLSDLGTSEQVGGDDEVRIGGVFGDRECRGAGVDVDGLGAHRERCLSVFAQHIASIEK